MRQKITIVMESILYGIGAVSAGLYARNFYSILTTGGAILVEPNTTIASVEFIVAVIGAIGLFIMGMRRR